MEAKASTTALSATYVRSHHHLYAHPKIFDDTIAHRLLVAEERELLETNYLQTLDRYYPTLAASSSDHDTAIAQAMQAIAGVAEVLERSRYAEDALEQAIGQGVQQYVLMGAGLDTFGFRRPDLNASLQVFEVDHPAMQAFKRQRLAQVGLASPTHVHFVPVDFENGRFAIALERSGYQREIRAFYSWLGVTQHISREAFLTTLQDIHNVASVGSSVVFDYFDSDAYDPDKVAPRMQSILDAVRRLSTRTEVLNHFLGNVP